MMVVSNCQRILMVKPPWMEERILTLDVESLDVTGSIGTPSIDPSHSEASFELKVKGNSGSLKKEKKKMKKKKRKEKKDGKKKKDDRLHMSIDLEPGKGLM